MEIILVALVTGGMYSLLAVGFSLIYGVARITNLAHTAFYMLTAYLMYFFISAVGLPLIVAAILGIAGTVLIGTLFYQVIINPIREHEMTVLMVTVATALLFQEGISMYYKSQYRTIPAYVSGSATIFGVAITWQYIITFIAAMVVLVAIWFWLYRTRMGLAVRSTAQDRETANLMGINVKRICLLVTLVSVGLAAVCGAVVAPIMVVEPRMWASPLVIMLAIVVLGGLGSIKGSIAGAFILAFAEVLIAFLVPGGAFFKSAVALAIMVLVLLFRPEGLFGVSFEEERL